MMRVEMETSFGAAPHFGWIAADCVTAIVPMGNYGSHVWVGGPHFRVRMLPDDFVAAIEKHLAGS